MAEAAVEGSIMSSDEKRKRAEEQEEEYHQKYLRKYHEYQRLFSEIDQEGRLQKQHFHNQLNEKAGINKVLRNTLAQKEA